MLVEVMCTCTYGGTVRLRWNDNYSTTHIYRYLLMSKVVQSEELGHGLFAIICHLLLSGVPGVRLMRGWTRMEDHGGQPAESGRCSCWPTAACCRRGRPSSRCGVTGKPDVVCTVLRLPCRGSPCCVVDSLLLPNALLSDELPLVG